MYFQRAKFLREEFEYTQQFVADFLNCKRSTYANWETGYIILPLDIANKLAILYNVPLSYILGIDTIKFVDKKIKNIDYDYLRKRLMELKSINKNSYSEIFKYIDIDRSTVNRYFNGKVTIPTDKLILLCDFYDVEIDDLCGIK